MHEFSVQDADLLPVREALQAGMTDLLGGLLSGALGVPNSDDIPTDGGASLYGNPNGLLHAGPRPMPAIF